MNDSVMKINAIMKRYLREESSTDDETQIRLFFGDLDIKGKKKILDAIDASYEFIDVYEDSIIKDKIEDALSRIPLMTISGEELINKCGIDL